MDDSIVIGLIRMEQQLRILHWQTKSFARHTAYGKIYNGLGELIDTFMEASMGEYGRFQLSDGAIQLRNLDELNVGETMDEYIGFLLSFNEKLDPARDSDLLNLRDELLTDVKQLKYLLTLK
jgi:hypothetical protein